MVIRNLIDTMNKLRPHGRWVVAQVWTHPFRAAVVLFLVATATHWCLWLGAWRLALQEWDRPGIGRMIHTFISWPLGRPGSMYPWYSLLSFGSYRLNFPADLLPFVNSSLWGAVGAGIVFATIRLGTSRPNPESRQCPTCSYDLRGNPAATHCPECGATV